MVWCKTVSIFLPELANDVREGQGLYTPSMRLFCGIRVPPRNRLLQLDGSLPQYHHSEPASQPATDSQPPPPITRQPILAIPLPRSNEHSRRSDSLHVSLKLALPGKHYRLTLCGCGHSAKPL
jgi:hypothetical protein